MDNTSSENDSSKQQLNMSVAFEEALEKAGSWGRWQKVMFFVISASQVFTAMHSVSAVYIGATPDFKCQVPELMYDPYNVTVLLEELSIPFVSECRTHLHNYTAINDMTSTSMLTVDMLHPFLSNDTELCQSWRYDDSVYQSTVVTEWDLVCSKKWLKTTVQATFMAGILIGSTMFGQLADKIGRRTTILWCSFCLVILSIGTSFTQNYGTFLAMRFLVALHCAGIMVTQFVLLMEVIKPEARTVTGMFDGSPFGLGVSLVAIFAYFIRSWRALHFALGSFSSLLLIYYFILPESPRWLVLKERPKESLKILKQIAKYNRKTLPEDEEMMKLLNTQSVQETVTEDKTLLARFLHIFSEQMFLVRTPNMRRRCLISFFSWFASAMIYYGLIFYTASDLKADPFLMVIISGLTETPMYIVVIFSLMRFGRRITACSLFFSVALVLTTLILIPLEHSYAIYGLATLGKTLSTGVFQLCYLYTSELVPTGVRNVAVGTSSMFARVGSSMAPFIIDFLGDLHYTVPSIVFAILSLIAGSLSLFLPETMNKPLPQTIEEVENEKR